MTRRLLQRRIPSMDLIVTHLQVHAIIFHPKLPDMHRQVEPTNLLMMECGTEEHSNSSINLCNDVWYCQHHLELLVFIDSCL